MISLAPSSTHTRKPAETQPTGTDTGRAQGGFSAVLAQQAPRKSEPASQVPSQPPSQTRSDGEKALRPDETRAASQDGKAPSPAPAGTAMPATAKGGKNLPAAQATALPATVAAAKPAPSGKADSEDKSDDADETATQAAADAVLALAIVPQAPLPTGAAEAEASEGAQAAGSAPARPALPALPLPAQGSVSRTGKPQAEAEGDKADGASVALQVAPQPTARTAEAGLDTRAEGDAPGARPRETAAERIGTQAATPDTARPADFAGLSAPALSAPTLSAPAPAAPSAGDGRTAMQADAVQDLTRIVDRLAAAREVFAPATEALSIDHAEFGELSLRFDQRRDGALAVQLSASNPDAHRAVAQAVGAQSFHSAADGQPQGQSSSQPQPQTAARGGMADREGTAGNGQAARHDRPESQQRRAAAQPDSGDGRQRAGIFA